MVNIIIKSFNRPYYLDRCLQSIAGNVSGSYEILVVDDGTPEKYLNKIREKFPRVRIRLSNQYDYKVKSIEENLKTGKEINGFQIPTQLWYDAVKNASEYVVITEDDVWFTQPVDLDEFARQMEASQIDLLKLGWLGNGASKIDSNLEISTEIDAENLKGIFTSNQWIMDCFFHNKYMFFSILYRLGMVDNQTKMKYWKLNSILMGMWRKDYWLHVWKDIDVKVDEKQQLRNAATWLHKNKSNPNLVAELKVNSLRTTFQSSATNSYHTYGSDFDVNYFNHLINEAWLNDEFDAMENFPQDFNLHYLDQFLDTKINKTSFHNWVEKFKQQYRKLGFQID